MSRRFDFFPTNETISQYRKVFSTGAGLDVLNHMMYDLGLFVYSDSPEDVALRNYGLRLISILSGDDIDEHTIKAFFKDLMRQQLQKEQKR